MRLDITEILATIKKGIKYIWKGRFMSEFIHIDRYFLHVFYAIFLIWLTLLIDIRIEECQTRIEKNNEILADYKIYHAQKKVQLIKMNRVSTIDNLLRQMGSDVTYPQTPAEIVK